VQPPPRKKNLSDASRKREKFLLQLGEVDLVTSQPSWERARETKKGPIPAPKDTLSIRKGRRPQGEKKKDRRAAAMGEPGQKEKPMRFCGGKKKKTALEGKHKRLICGPAKGKWGHVGKPVRRRA